MAETTQWDRNGGVYLVSAARTPIGKFGGALSQVPAVELGGVAIRAAVERSGLPAEAVIDGSEVVVQSKDVTSPTQVRFGWRYVAQPNLINKEGLPASPFQTKDWTGGTGE